MKMRNLQFNRKLELFRSHPRNSFHNTKTRYSIENAIRRAFEKAYQRNWDRIYFAIDLHETCIVPDYQTMGNPEFYPHAERVLQKITNREDIVTILWTCSNPIEIARYQEFLAQRDIVFDYVNENPEVESDKYIGWFELKFYTNVFLDDKGGFDWETDWIAVEKVLDEEFPTSLAEACIRGPDEMCNDRILTDPNVTWSDAERELMNRHHEILQTQNNKQNHKKKRTTPLITKFPR